ncbi:MAG: hypothetical protein ACRDY7_00185, partial [Acidimicrobiia bacterium]
MRRLWTWYGAVLILAGLWLTSTLLYYAAMRDQVAAQAEWSGASFDEGEFKSHFWAGLFANQQAEWAHLLFTTVVLGGFGYACFRKGRRASLR